MPLISLQRFIALALIAGLAAVTPRAIARVAVP
jgi:hypothetical protein